MRLVSTGATRWTSADDDKWTGLVSMCLMGRDKFISQDSIRCQYVSQGSVFPSCPLTPHPLNCAIGDLSKTSFCLVSWARRFQQDETTNIDFFLGQVPALLTTFIFTGEESKVIKNSRVMRKEKIKNHNNSRPKAITPSCSVSNATVFIPSELFLNVAEKKESGVRRKSKWNKKRILWRLAWIQDSTYQLMAGRKPILANLNRDVSHISLGSYEKQHQEELGFASCVKEINSAWPKRIDTDTCGCVSLS